MLHILFALLSGKNIIVSLDIIGVANSVSSWRTAAASSGTVVPNRPMSLPRVAKTRGSAAGLSLTNRERALAGSRFRHEAWLLDCLGLGSEGCLNFALLS